MKLRKFNNTKIFHANYIWRENFPIYGKLSGTLTLFVVLGPVRQLTIKPFLSWPYSHEERYQALLCFSVLQAMEAGWSLETRLGVLTIKLCGLGTCAVWQATLKTSVASVEKPKLIYYNKSDYLFRLWQFVINPTSHQLVSYGSHAQHNLAQEVCYVTSSCCSFFFTCSK